MKVKELIKELEKENPEIDIVISGYEGGYDDINSICKIKIKNNVNKGIDYLGAHERVYYDNEEFDREVIFI